MQNIRQTFGLFKNNHYLCGITTKLIVQGSMKWKKISFDATMIIILSLCLYPFRSYLSLPTIDNGTEDNISFSPELYNTIHANSVNPDTSITISLVDISDLSGPDSHDQISSVIDCIRSYHPRMLGIDVVFKKQSGYVKDSALISAASKNQDSTVFVMDLIKYDNRSQVYKDCHQSFFADSLKCKEGFSNLLNRGDQQYVSKFVPRQTMNGRDIFSLPIIMAGSAIDTTQLKSSRYIIDYTPVHFPRMSHTSIDSSLIADRYVLLGGLWDNNDMFNTPIGLKSGIEIHAYTLRTLLECNLMDDGISIWEYLLCFLISVGFCFLLVIIDAKLTYTKDNVIRYLGQESLLSMGVAVVITFILSFIGYLCFMNGVFISMGIALDVILRVATAAKIIYVLIIIILSSRFKCNLSISTYSKDDNVNK